MTWFYLGCVLIWVQPTGETEYYSKSVKTWYKSANDCTVAYNKLRDKLEKMLVKNGATQIEIYGFCKPL